MAYLQLDVIRQEEEIATLRRRCGLPDEHEQRGTPDMGLTQVAPQDSELIAEVVPSRRGAFVQEECQQTENGWEDTRYGEDGCFAVNAARSST